MKKLLILLMLIWVSGSLSAQSIGDYVGTELLSSPDKRFLITIDFYQGEAGGIPKRTFLYKLPLDTSNRVALENYSQFHWSRDSKHFYANVGNGGKQMMTSSVIIYDEKGQKVRTILSGTSLGLFMDGSGIYMKEFDETGKWIGPRLMTYDMTDNKSGEYFVFGDSLSFWNEQIDQICYPMKAKSHWGGILVALYEKGDPDIMYTFIVHDQKGIIFQKKGDYLNMEYPPEDGLMKK